MHQLNCKESSNLHWARYDEATHVLEVDFKNSKGEKVSTYAYANFPPTEWDRFRAAPSKGKFFAFEIRNATFTDGAPKYPATKVADLRSTK